MFPDMLPILVSVCFLVFDLDQTLLELFKVPGYCGEWIAKGHIVPVHSYIRILLRRLGYQVKSSGPLRTDQKSKKHGSRNYVNFTHLKVIEILAEIMDTIIYNGGKGGSLINGLFDASRINLNCLINQDFIKSVKFLEPQVTKLIEALEESNLTLEDIIELCKPPLSEEERNFFTQCSRKAMPKQNSAKYISIINIFIEIEKHNANPKNTTKFLIGMFSAGDGYMLDFLKQSELKSFFKFSIDFGIENQMRGAFDIRTEDGSYPDVRCKPDTNTFITVDKLISKSITKYSKDNACEVIGINVVMIDDNQKVCDATTEYNNISHNAWKPFKVNKIESVGHPEKPSVGTLYGTQNQIINYIAELLLSNSSNSSNSSKSS